MNNDRESEFKALIRALKASRWSPKEVAMLRSQRGLTAIRQFLKGNARIQYLKHIIDFDANPYIPDGWQLVSSNKGGKFKWNPKQVKLYWTEIQEKPQGIISGEQMLAVLKDVPVANSNLLDHLLNNPLLIPDEWKKDQDGRPYYILFSGSIFIDKEGRHVVRALMWNPSGKQGRWSDAKVLLSGGFGIEFPSLVLNKK